MKVLVTVLVALFASSAAFANNTGFELTPSPRAAATNVTVTGTQTDGPQGGCSFVEITIEADIEGINDLDGGNDQVRFSIFDDGAERAFEVVSVPVGTTETVSVTLSFEGVIGQGAAGVAAVIFDGPTSGGSQLFLLDNFDPDTVVGSCPGDQLEFRSVPVNSPLALGLMTLLLGMIAAGAIRFRS
jgi:hypothetical protein